MARTVVVSEQHGRGVSLEANSRGAGSVHVRCGELAARSMASRDTEPTTTTIHATESRSNRTEHTLASTRDQTTACGLQTPQTHCARGLQGVASPHWAQDRAQPVTVVGCFEQFATADCFVAKHHKCTLARTLASRAGTTKAHVQCPCLFLCAASLPPNFVVSVPPWVAQGHVRS